jgi:hypothetical protein
LDITWSRFAALNRETLPGHSALAKSIAAGKRRSARLHAQTPNQDGESLMSSRHHTLLAGFAALALFAASGIAAAQQTQQGAGGAAQNSPQSQRGQQGANTGANTQGGNQSANRGARNQSAQRGQNQNVTAGQSLRQNAQNQSRMQSRQGNAASANRSAQMQNRNRIQRGTSTAQRNERLNGLQGSTRAPMQGANEQGGGGANVSLNDQQRSQIRNTVLNSRNAPRVSNPNFGVNVGTVVPRGQIRLVRVPSPLVRIRPAWRNFLYFVYNDQIVIVNPRTMRIVNVLPV